MLAVLTLTTGCSKKNSTGFEKNNLSDSKVQAKITKAKNNSNYYSFGYAHLEIIETTGSKIELECSATYENYLNTEYEIYRKNLNSIEPIWEKIDTTNNSNYTDRDVKAGLIYEYKIKAVYSNYSLESRYSNIVKYDNRYIKGKGTIKYVDMEGGFYGIVSEDGKKYDPINLSDKYKKDGLKINFKFVNDKKAGYHMWGKTVKIEEIELQKDYYIQGTGTVEYIDIEGGFYGIISSNGKKYKPNNLPDEYKQDGLEVSFILEKAEDQNSIYMWGTIVNIIELN